MYVKPKFNNTSDNLLLLASLTGFVVSITILFLIHNSQDYRISQRLYTPNNNKRPDELEPDWSTYTNHEHGFSIMYPNKGSFNNVTTWERGLILDNNQEGVFYNAGVPDVMIKVHRLLDPPIINSIDSIDGLIDLASMDGFSDEKATISSGTICGKSIARSEYDLRIRDKTHQRAYSVYFYNDNKVYKAFMDIGFEYVNTYKEEEYKLLFEEMLHTMHLF